MKSEWATRSKSGTEERCPGPSALLGVAGREREADGGPVDTLDETPLRESRSSARDESSPSEAVGEDRTSTGYDTSVGGVNDDDDRSLRPLLRLLTLAAEAGAVPGENLGKGRAYLKISVFKKISKNLLLHQRI